MNKELARTRLRVRRVLHITLAWVIMGCVAAVFEHGTLKHHGVPSSLRVLLDQRFLPSLVAGLFGGSLYIFVLRDRWRKLPYTTAVGIMAALLFGIVLVFSAALPAAMGQGPGVVDRLFSLQFVGTFLYWSLIMAATMLMVRFNDQYGNGGMSYLTGFYHKPRQEMRIFMFLDMRSSTSIAEELGHVRYFQLLNELYSDITDPIIYSRGEIYQYVGDEISVSWPLRRGVARQRCIRCFVTIRQKMLDRAAHYQARYGMSPVFKAGFHYGPVTTGEVGLVKKERIYSGDVVNTAAHIQNQCNTHGVDNLMSQDLVDVLRLPSTYELREIGSTDLKGKRQAIRLWTLVQEEARPVMPKEPRSSVQYV